MRKLSPYLRAGAAFAAVIAGGGWLWFEWDAKLDGFASHSDRRAAHAAGILAGAEWRAMRAAGDIAAATESGEGCTSEACRTAEAQLGGRWAGGGPCADADFYRFTDGFAEVTSHRQGKATDIVRRRYRIVAAPVTLRLLRGPDGQPMERTAVKLPGDIEVFTIGRSSYVRRIFRAADQDTVRLVLVEQRAGRSGPASAVVVDGRRAGGTGDGVVYRRCPPA